MQLFGILIGIISILNGHYKIGIKRVINPVGYWRYPVFNYIISELEGIKSLRTLDIGSPKLLALYFALKEGYKVYATDLQDSEIFSTWQTYYRDCKKCNLIKLDRYKDLELYFPELEDGRKLKYPDNYFDLVYSISVLEHIPEDGDSITIREIQRVLKPNGIAIIELPFSDKQYDSYVDHDVYEREYIENPVFYERHYDHDTIYSRIINPSGMMLFRSIIFKERVPFSSYINKLPLFLQIPFLILTPIISKINHVRYDYTSNNDISMKSGASDIILILKKLPTY